MNSQTTLPIEQPLNRKSNHETCKLDSIVRTLYRDTRCGHCPGNDEIQLDLFLSYGSNPPHYPQWQAYLRAHQPPTLIVWGKNDPIFPEAGAHPYLRDLKEVDFHLLDTGHFALEEDGVMIADLIRTHLQRHTR